MHVNARFLRKNNACSRSFRLLHHASKVVQIRQKQLSELFRHASRLQEVHHIEGDRIFGNVIISRDLRPVAGQLLHECVVYLVVALVHAVARVVENLAFCPNLPDDLVRVFLGLEFLPELFRQLPFPQEIVLFRILSGYHSRHHIAVIGQQILVSFPDVKQWICRVFQNVRYLPERLVFREIDRQRGYLLDAAILNVGICHPVAAGIDPGKCRRDRAHRHPLIFCRHRPELFKDLRERGVLELIQFTCLYRHFPHPPPFRPAFCVLLPARLTARRSSGSDSPLFSAFPFPAVPAEAPSRSS